MKTLCEAAGVTLRTNHAGRRTFSTRLVEQLGDLHQVAQYTGHKNVKSLDTYTLPNGKRLESTLAALAPPAKRQRTEVTYTNKQGDNEETFSFSQESVSDEEKNTQENDQNASIFSNCSFGNGNNFYITINK